MAKTKIIVVGSSNTDMVVKTNKFPTPGETILGGEFLMNQGGKGANQAVAAARLGGNVYFVGKVGNDIFGKQSRKALEVENIDVSFLIEDNERASGVALITVDKNAENAIVVAPGANAALTSNSLPNIDKLIDRTSLVLMQLEIPISTVEEIAELANKKGAKVILNPAPAHFLPKKLYRDIFLITPNEKEASSLTGITITDLESAKKAAKALVENGTQNVIITLGQKGALVYHNNRYTHIEGHSVTAVDTTAAGDVFNGALTFALTKNINIIEAAEFACKAAAVSVTKMGAQASAPSTKELEDYFTTVAV